MFRRSLAAVVVMFFVGSMVVAATYNGVITKISKDEVTVKVFKDKKDKEGEEKKFKIGKDVKYYMAPAKKGDDPKESTLDDTTKAVETAVEKSPAKGARAKIETDGEGDKEVVTKITLGGRGKKN